MSGLLALQHDHVRGGCSCGNKKKHRHGGCCGHSAHSESHSHESHEHGGCSCGQCESLGKSNNDNTTHTDSEPHSSHMDTEDSCKDEEDGCSCGKERGEEDTKNERNTLILGGAIFAAGLMVEHLLSLPSYAAIALYVFGYLVLGNKVLIRAFNNIKRGKVFDENFLMCVATIGAFAIGDFTEAAAVMLFYQTGEFFQGLAVSKSKKSIVDLMDIRPDYANIYRNGEIVRVKPDEVKVGEFIVVKPGEKVPLDGVVTRGNSTLDTSALTGESAPREVTVSSVALSGCVNLNGVLTVKVSKTFGQSTAAKIIDMVENASNKKAHTENFITSFAKYYTPAVVLLAALIAIVPSLIYGDWSEWIHRGLIFLVISCPCALVISIPLSFFAGIGGASKKGILVKGGNFLEALNDVGTIVFDKTGTLTKGVFEVTNILPAKGFSRTDVIKSAAKAEAFSDHPTARSILKAYGKKIDKNTVQEYKELVGRGVKAVIEEKTILAGNYLLMTENNINCTEEMENGSKVYVAQNGKYMGCIIISDTMKRDSKIAITNLRKQGIRKLVMLTGDNRRTGEAIAEELGLDDCRAELLPDQKVEEVERLISANRGKRDKIAFVGDGINDAPVLARADVGVAMGAFGSDAAIEAADVVLMTDEPSKLVEAIRIARATKKIVWQNIIFALGVKGIFLCLGAIGIFTMWEAV
ncbi:MAG: cadmium-translocating P-type ATPase, partial [Clostridiales bacterium]|nr:cadmium-translocating P-type ATPase [Clostridiales bacterium]